MEPGCVGDGGEVRHILQPSPCDLLDVLTHALCPPLLSLIYLVEWAWGHYGPNA